MPDVPKTAYVLCVEVSDQYGTSAPIAVYSTRSRAAEAQARVKRARSFIKPLPLDPQEPDLLNV